MIKYTSYHLYFCLWSQLSNLFRRIWNTFFFSKFYTYFKRGIIYAVQWQNKKEGLYGEVSSYLCCWYRQDNIYCQNFIYGIFEMQELNPRILQRRAYISNWIEKNGQKKYRMQKCRSPPLIQTVIYI